MRSAVGHGDPGTCGLHWPCLEIGFVAVDPKTVYTNSGVFWSSAPCASPAPRPSIFSDFSFWVHHLVNRDLLAHAMASDFSVARQCLSKRTIVFLLRIKLHTLIRLGVSHQFWHRCMEWSTVWVSSRLLITEESWPAQGLIPSLPIDTQALYLLLHKLMPWTVMFMSCHVVQCHTTT
jgi:hypothetical protein